mmetsp:Transcript_30150/g.79172  ORF Transcript_30150/g.79172 Transcript_30150/m.79172 type:complete len:230 (+) Transcript_30150:450-1139(+)
MLYRGDGTKNWTNVAARRVLRQQPKHILFVPFQALDLDVSCVLWIINNSGLAILLHQLLKRSFRTFDLSILHLKLGEMLVVRLKAKVDRIGFPCTRILPKSRRWSGRRKHRLGSLTDDFPSSIVHHEAEAVHGPGAELLDAGLLELAASRAAIRHFARLVGRVEGILRTGSGHTNREATDFLCTLLALRFEADKNAVRLAGMESGGSRHRALRDHLARHCTCHCARGVC